MSLQLENRWREDTHHYVRWSEDSRQVIRLYKPRLQQQLVLTPRCGHLKGNGGVKGAVRFAQRLTNQYAPNKLKAAIKRMYAVLEPFSVEWGCGAVALGLVCLWPPLSSGGARVSSP